MTSIVDERGFNQGFSLVKSTEVRMRRRAGNFVRDMVLKEPKEILEIGCGTGEISHWIAEQSGMQVLGTDLSQQFISYARSHYRRSNLRYEVLDFTKPEELSGRRFDYVIGNGILHHLFYSLEASLLTMRNLLRERGSILFYEPNIYNPYCVLIFKIPFLRTLAHLEPTEMAFSKTFIQKTLHRAGFRDISVDYRDFLIPGVPESLIQPLIAFGDVAERTPILKMLAQSLYIRATL